MNNISEEKITSGIEEFARFKELAKEALDRAKMAEEESHYYKGQKEQLESLLKANAERHRTDLARIAELETFVATVIEQYRAAEERLRLGAYRRPTSTPLPPLEAELHEGIRKLATPTVSINSGGRPVPNQERS